MNNPITNPEGFAEGFYLYHFKSGTLPSELFMRGEFNNASTGVSTKLMATNNLNLPINELVTKLHVRYLLTRDSTGFYYEIDKNYNNNTNVTEIDSNVILNLYQIKVK